MQSSRSCLAFRWEVRPCASPPARGLQPRLPRTPGSGSGTGLKCLADAATHDQRAPVGAATRSQRVLAARTETAHSSPRRPHGLPPHPRPTAGPPGSPSPDRTPLAADAGADPPGRPGDAALVPGRCPERRQNPGWGSTRQRCSGEPAAAGERLSLICAGRVKPFQEWF